MDVYPGPGATSRIAAPGRARSATSLACRSWRAMSFPVFAAYQRAIGPSIPPPLYPLAIVDDRRHRLVVYSRHSEPTDAVRQSSILQRCVSAEVMAWLRAFELARARRPVRTPHNEALGMLPRVCVPIRHHELLLGYLWF